MATRVTGWTEITAPVGTESLAADDGANKRITPDTLKAYSTLAKGQIAVTASNGVTFYQCTADGSTNDQGTIETALFAARDNLPAFVEFGPGRYGIYKGTTLAITQGSGNLIIKGNNTRLVWSKNGIPDNQAYVALKIWPAVLPTVGDYANYLQNVTVDGMEFEDLYPVAHEGGTTEQTHGIQLKYIQNAVISNCLAYNIGDEAFDMAFVQNGKIINNTGIATPSPLLVGVANTGAATINLQNCRNVVVTNNTVQGSTVAGTKSALAGSSGIGLENVVSDPDDDISGIVISNNVVRDFADAGILVNNSDSGTEVKDSAITSNILDNCGQGVGFIGNNMHRNFVVQANVIKGVAEGIKFDLLKENNLDCVVAFNQISDCTSDGILCNGTRVSLSGNNISNGSGRAIFCSQGVDVSISGGIIDDCGGASLPDIQGGLGATSSTNVTVDGVTIRNSNSDGRVTRYVDHVKNCHIHQTTPTYEQVSTCTTATSNVLNGGIRPNVGVALVISGNHIDSGGTNLGGVTVLTNTAANGANNNSVISNNYIKNAASGTDHQCIRVVTGTTGCLITSNVAVNVGGVSIWDQSTNSIDANNQEVAE